MKTLSLLAETTASIHAAINPLIDRAFVGTSLLKKTYTSMTDDKLKEEVREVYKGHSAAIMGIVKKSQDKVYYALKAHPGLTMLFHHKMKEHTTVAVMRSISTQYARLRLSTSQYS